LKRPRCEECEARKFSPNVCEVCPDKESQAEGPEAAFGNLIILLKRLKESGAVFRLSDLSYLEWRGLMILDEEIESFKARELKEAERKAKAKTKSITRPRRIK